jgi:hypothetical protein
MRARVLLVALATVGLMSSCAAASPTGDEPTLQYGTVTGKGYEPPTREVRCSGAMHRPGACKQVDVPECWRLDLRMWLVLPVSACVPKHRWEQMQVGDYWGGK